MKELWEVKDTLWRFGYFARGKNDGYTGNLVFPGYIWEKKYLCALEQIFTYNVANINLPRNSELLGVPYP